VAAKDSQLYSRAKLLQARDVLVEWNVFLGLLMLRMQVQIVDQGPCETAWVDEKGICSFHTRFISQISSSEAAAILLHETLHLALDCFKRRENRDHRLWNIAHDLVVNQLIEESRMNRQPVSWPIGFTPLLEPSFKGLNAERVYDLLWDALSLLKRTVRPPGHPGLANVDRQRQICESWGEDRIRDAKKVLKQVPSLDLQVSTGTTNEDREQLARKWRESLLSTAEQAMGIGGSNGLPSWAQRLLGPILEPRVSWQQVLARKVHAHLQGGRRSFARPGRRSNALGISMPGRIRDRGVVGVFVDVSGSISSADLGSFLGEIQSILTTTGHSVRLVTWDTSIGVDRYLENPSELSLALVEWNSSISGGGGTDPRCIIDHLAHSQGEIPQPTYGVILTDGYCRWPEISEWPMDVLVVSTAETPDKSTGYEGIVMEPINKYIRSIY